MRHPLALGRDDLCTPLFPVSALQRLEESHGAAAGAVEAGPGVGGVCRRRHAVGHPPVGTLDAPHLGRVPSVGGCRPHLPRRPSSHRRTVAPGVPSGSRSTLGPTGWRPSRYGAFGTEAEVAGRWAVPLPALRAAAGPCGDTRTGMGVAGAGHAPAGPHGAGGAPVDRTVRRTGHGLRGVSAGPVPAVPHRAPSRLPGTPPAGPVAVVDEPTRGERTASGPTGRPRAAPASRGVAARRLRDASDTSGPPREDAPGSHPRTTHGPRHTTAPNSTRPHIREDPGLSVSAGDGVFGHLIQGAPGRIRTCAHGSGGRLAIRYRCWSSPWFQTGVYILSAAGPRHSDVSRPCGLALLELVATPPQWSRFPR